MTVDSPAGGFSAWRRHEPGQSSQLRVHDVETGLDRLVYETNDAVIEAPNWSPDGLWLVINCDGLLYRVSAAGGGSPELIATEGLADSNNDHVLAPDGSRIYSSSKNGHLYEVRFAGGPVRQITHDGDGLRKRYLHGVSPDGRSLALIGLRVIDGVPCFNVYTASILDGTITPLTDGTAPHDGAEFSPDSEHIYFNSERGSSVPGHAQIFRMRLDGSEVEQLTHDERVNWFPHLSPDGRRMLYLSYAPGTTQHPANRAVELRLAAPDGHDPRTLVSLFGGQGTVNVNSWAFDSRRFAYVSYPVHPKSPPPPERTP